MVLFVRGSLFSVLSLIEISISIFLFGSVKIILDFDTIIMRLYLYNDPFDLDLIQSTLMIPICSSLDLRISLLSSKSNG